VLDRYYTTFPIYNPYLEQLPVKGRRDNYKYYDVDGMTGGNGNNSSYGNYGHLNNGNGYYGNSYGLHPNNDSRVSSPAFRGKKEFGHNDLFYEEYEYERRSVLYVRTYEMLHNFLLQAKSKL
jgi:vang-like